MLLPQLLWRCVCISDCMVVVALFIKRGESLFPDMVLHGSSVTTKSLDTEGGGYDHMVVDYLLQLTLVS